MARHPYVNYQADLPGFAQASYDAQQMLMPIGQIAETEGVLFCDRLDERDRLPTSISGRSDRHHSRPSARSVNIRRPGEIVAKRSSRRGPQGIPGIDGRAECVRNEETSMLKQEENELIMSSRTWHADGQLHARVLGSRDALVRATRTGLRSAAGNVARRAVDRLPRLQRQARPDPEPLPASGRVAVLRPQ